MVTSACFIYCRCSKQEHPLEHGIDVLPGPVHTNRTTLHVLPESWNPNVAPITVMPDELGMQDVIIELFGHDDDPTLSLDICNPDTALQRMNYNNGKTQSVGSLNFDELIEAMSCSYERKNMLNTWLELHVDLVQVLSPREMSKLFSLITFPDAQIEVASQLKLIRLEITCLHVGEVAAECLDICTREVVAILCCIRIIDVENKKSIQDNMSPLDYLSIVHLLVSST